MTVLLNNYLDLTMEEAETLLRKLGYADAVERATKDIDFEHLHPRYPRGHPRAGEFMDKADLEKYESLHPISELIGSKPTKRSRSAKFIDGALESIDKVLRFPEIADEHRVDIQHGGYLEETYGRYSASKNAVYVFDTSQPRGDFPVQEEVPPLQFHENPGGEGTVVHELAHWIDHRMLGQGLGTQDIVDAFQVEHPEDQFPSGMAVTMDHGEVWSDMVEPLSEFINAIGNSPSIQVLVNHIKDPTAVIVTYPETGAEEVNLPDEKFVRYLLHPAEWWARAFEQYIALRSGDLDQQQFITFFRVESQVRPIHYPHYWNWDEFEPIAEAMDKLFAAMGWLRADVADGRKDAPSESDRKDIIPNTRYDNWDPIEHPRWPEGFPEGGQFMEKPHNLDTPEKRLMFGEGTMDDLLAILDERWRPKDEREAREWGHVIYEEVEKDRGLKAERTRTRNAYDAAYKADMDYRWAAGQLATAQSSVRHLDEWLANPETSGSHYEPNEVEFVNTEYRDKLPGLIEAEAKAMYERSVQDNKWNEQQQRLVNTHQNAILRVLRQIHPEYGDKQFKIEFGTPRLVGDHEAFTFREPPNERRLGPDVRSGLRKLRNASRFLPPSWLKVMNEAGSVGVKSGTGRAFHQTVIGDERIDSVIRMPVNADEDTALHELGHRAQSVFPWAHSLEVEFWERRTQGLALKQLYDPPDPEFGREYTIPDRFFDPYVGKAYAKRLTPSYYDDPKEIITMGLEHLFYGGPYSDWNQIDPFSEENHPYSRERRSVWEADREHAEFILGLLASDPSHGR